MTIPQQGSISLDSTAGWLWRGVHECRCSPRNSGSVHPDNSLAYPDRDNLSACVRHGTRYSEMHLVGHRRSWVWPKRDQDSGTKLSLLGATDVISGIKLSLHA